MNKTILLIIIGMLLAVIPASAYHYGSYGAYYPYHSYVNQGYSDYYDTYGYKTDTKYRNAVKRFDYQSRASPYFLVRSPYGKKPYYKPHGDAGYKPADIDYINPFYGFSHYRTYHCHSPDMCHYHNIFPNSPNH